MRGVRERFGMASSILCILLAPIVLAISLMAFSPSTTLFAQDTRTDTITNEKYSPQVVAKAEKILEEIGIKRSGKTFTCKNTAEVTRGLSGLARERRKLKLAQLEWKKASDHAANIRNTINQLTAQNGELNLELARVAGDETANYRVAALINAGVAKINLLRNEEKKAKEFAEKQRNELGDVNSKYAETILAIRKDFETAQTTVAESLKKKDAAIALKVMHANFSTPAEVTAEAILLPLEKRLERVEQEIFSELIQLDVESNGSLYVDVIVGKSTTRMVVDSGASMVSLPMKTAVELGIQIPLDARKLRLVMADGRSIAAKAVTLPRVRVGQFEAENVAAAILDSTADGAEPLLGMSFLGNFKFEINSNDKTLKMLRVSTE